MKERVVDVDQSQGSHLNQIAKALEQKLNALDVRIAKATFELDEKLGLIEKKSQALENQAAKMSSSKVDLKSMNTAVAKLEKRIKTHANRNKSTLEQMERTHLKLQASIKENKAQFKSGAGQIKDEIQLFKEEFDARLLELSAYEQQIEQLTKKSSLLDKQIKTLKQDVDGSIDKKLATQKNSFEKKIKELEIKTKLQVSTRAPRPILVTPKPPKPALPDKNLTPEKPVVPLDTGKSKSGISEQTLTQ